ncbi:MAG: LON peptidase substrate-binding domain-containing protein [Myxococcota bacterium]
MSQDDADIPDDLEGALEAMPLFPLKQAVLFPGALLPLHVFEPRYRKLVADVLASHRTMSVPQVLERPEGEGDDEGGDPARPPIARVAGVGTIIEHAELPGGRFNIVLLGRGRVALDELPFAPPYRRATAKLLRTTRDDDVPPLELTALHAAVHAFAKLVREKDSDFELRLPKGPPSLIVDACAHHLVLDARQRQEALETLDVVDRVRRVTEVLTIQRAALSPTTSSGLN